MVACNVGYFALLVVCYYSKSRSATLEVHTFTKAKVASAQKAEKSGAVNTHTCPQKASGAISKPAVRECDHTRATLSSRMQRSAVVTLPSSVQHKRKRDGGTSPLAHGWGC